MTKTRFKIIYKRLDERLFTYSVEEYKTVDDGAFIEFYDNRTSETLRLPVQNVEIRVVGGEDGG